MTRVRAALLVVSMLMVVSCSTTGGTIGGLIPAPKFLKGDIKDNIYSAQDKSFSVEVPHQAGSYEYKYMQVKEQYSEHGAYVSFGPAALNQSIYRLGTVKGGMLGSKNVQFDTVAAKLVETYKTQLQSGYGTAFHEVASRQEKINNRKAHYWKFTQRVPAGKFLNNSEATFMHYVYVIDFEKGAAAIVAVQKPETTTNAKVEPREFVESVVMY